MFFLILERLLNHLQFIQILDDLRIVCLSMLVLKPKRLKIIAIILSCVLEYFLKGLGLFFKFFFLTIYLRDKIPNFAVRSEIADKSLSNVVNQRHL